MNVVVVHRGARDSYQVARALSEKGMLERLVTDLYWPPDKGFAAQLAHVLPGVFSRALLQRSDSALKSKQVKACWASGLLSFALEKSGRGPFALRRNAVRRTDDALGRAAGALASSRNCALLSYSYYGHAAFSRYTGVGPRILFQLHPHPASVREILRKELENLPECAESLCKEWELSLPEEDFARLVEETRMAEHWIAASSFTAQTLRDNGIPRERIHIIPYGVDLRRFQPDTAARAENGPLRLLFVGTINQRKGIRYLLEALRLLGNAPVELTVCGRAVDDLSLFRSFSRVTVRPSVSAAELAQAYRAADLFVFPSVAEGFGHVLLESLASGLPVLSTTRTAAPDLISEGLDGFVVAPHRSDLLAERLDWALTHRHQLARMRVAARATAERSTWERFRRQIGASVSDIVAGRRGAVEMEPLSHV